MKRIESSTRQNKRQRVEKPDWFLVLLLVAQNGLPPADVYRLGRVCKFWLGASLMQRAVERMAATVKEMLEARPPFDPLSGIKEMLQQNMSRDAVGVGQELGSIIKNLDRRQRKEEGWFFQLLHRGMLKAAWK